jgi:hypothetical protein
VIAIGERHDIHHQRVAGAAFDGRRETTRIFGAGIGIQQTKQIRFELVYEKTFRTSSEPTWRDYERHRLFASVLYGQ